MSPGWTSLLLALRIVALGEVWVTWPTGISRRWRLADGLDRLGSVVVLGLLLNLLPALLLAPLGWWTPVGDWVAWGLWLGAGAWRVRGALGLRARARSAGLAFAAVGMTALAVLLLPPRSEWWAGGWDPGLYQNNARAIAARNGLPPVRQTVYAAMTEAERSLVSQSADTYPEVLPGVPIQLSDGALPLFFFHLTPICGAWFHRLGGSDLLNRMPGMLALLGLWPVYSLLRRLGLRRWRPVAGVGLWCLAPMWWYQQAIPTTEPLYMLLLCGGLLFYVQAATARATWPLAAALCLLAATINHLNFWVVGGVLLLVAAGGEAAARLPGRLGRVGLGVVALAAGAAWDMVFAQTTIHKLHAKDGVLWLVLVPAVAISSLALLWAWRPLPSRWVARAGRAARWMFAGGAVGLAVLVAALSVPAARDFCFRGVDLVPGARNVLLRFDRLLAFHGAATFLLVGMGMGCAAWDRRPSRRALRLVVLGLGLVIVLFLVNGGVAPIYPWALRRYVIVAVPFMALTQTYGIIRLVESWRRIPLVCRGLGCLLMGLALVGGVKNSVAACRVGDYRGLSELLLDLDAQLEPGDVVVADDPRWGTPLLLAHGRDVLDGKRLWESAEPGFQADYLRMLRRLQREEGRRVLWLTSTEAGLGVYPLDIGPVAPVFEDLPFSYRTVVHSARADHFEARDNPRVFGLYEWQAAHAAAPVPTPVE